MRTPARALSLFAAGALSAGAPAAAQTHLSVSARAGSFFTGVGFGLHVGDPGPASAFVGLSFGLGLGGHYAAEPYGVYSARYDGWGYGHGSRAAYGYSCWDQYWVASWDPWSPWYWDCVVAGPYRSSYRARSWLHRHAWLGGPTAFVSWSDPYVAPWGPYWAYDPWGSYWNGYWTGSSAGWGSPRGWGYAPVRTVHASGGQRGVAVGRGSDERGAGVGYKEGAIGGDGRTAQRRPNAVAPTPTARQRASDLTGRYAAPRAAPSATAARGPGREAPQVSPANPSARRGEARSAAPRRPSDRVAPQDGAGTRPAATPSMNARSQAAPQRATPSANTRPQAAAPTRPTPSANARPQAAPKRATPSANSRPQAAPAQRSSQPQASQPRAAAPKASSSPPPRSSAPRASASPPPRASGSGGGSARPPRRPTGGDG